jgi:hypothetical protein
MRNMLCHCGNVTTIGAPVARSSPLMLDGHCLLCRCDEHGYAQTQPSTTTPGCGPVCRHRPHPEQLALLAKLETRDTPPDLVAWYKTMEMMSHEYITV